VTGGTAGHRHPGRRAGAAFALVAIATAVVAGVEVSRDGSPAGETVQASGGSPDGSPSATASPTSSPSPEPSASPSATPTRSHEPPTSYRCWSGSKVAAADECPTLNGVAGLTWVFPSLDPEACTNRLATDPSPRLRQLYECEVDVAGSRVTVDYVEWRSIADALDYYDAWGTRRVSIRGAGGRPLRFGWLMTTPGGSYVGALAYTDAPYSVSVTAPDEATRARAAREVIRLRPTARLTGVPLRG
jgi:hypothetical protein